MRVLWVSIFVVLLDQASKVAVLRTMHRGESIPVLGDWLKFTFTENPGMAFGIAIFPREATAIFSIIVTVLVLWYLYSVRSGYTPYLFSLALILGGAVGNIIDRVFYGAILGYGDFFMGKVVDFIHVDAWRGYLPEVLPWVGGAYLPLFPIWNVADMAIVVGVVGILTFQRRFHRQAFEEPARDRERLRELEKQQAQEQQEGTAAAGASHSAPGAAPSSTDVPPRAPSAEHAGAAMEAAAEEEDDEKFVPDASDLDAAERGTAEQSERPGRDASAQPDGAPEGEAKGESPEAEEADEDRSSYAPSGRS